MRFPRLWLPLAALTLASLVGAQLSFAATSATQNVTFTVAKAVSITNGGDITITPSIDPSSGTPTGTGASTVSVASNDGSGFQLAASTGASTVTESGGSCAGTNTANVNIMTIAAGTPTGGTGGAGTSAAAAALSTTASNLFSSVPTMTGATISVPTTYVVTPGYATKANSTSCSYKIPVTITVTAQ